MSKIPIVNTISKTTFKTFLSQFIQIHFFQQKASEAKELENLKNLLFPPEYQDKEYAELIEFISIIMDNLIKDSMDINKIRENISETHEFDEDILIMIDTTVKTQKNDIINHLNQKFNPITTRELVKLNWATKMVLAGNTEDYYNGKFVDLEFAHSSDDTKTNISHTTISLTKEDIGNVLTEFQLIKENLNKLNAIK